MKKFTIGDGDAIKILAAQRMGLDPVRVDDAKRQLEGGAIHPMTAAAIGKEAAEVNNRLRHNATLIAKANIYAEHVKAEYGFDVNMLQNSTIAKATEKTQMTDHVIRYVVTHINKDDMRTMCGPAQGRCTHATAEEAQDLLDAMMKNNPMKGELLAGVYGLPLEVRPVKCYHGHFDPIGVYFDTEAYAERMIQQEADRQVG